MKEVTAIPNGAISVYFDLFLKETPVGDICKENTLIDVLNVKEPS